MAIRPLNSSLIFDRRVILGLTAAVILAFTFAFLYSPDLRPSSEWLPPLSSKPTSTFSAPLKNTEDPNIVEPSSPMLRTKSGLTGTSHMPQMQEARTGFGDHNR
jgi:hypothetical protein